MLLQRPGLQSIPALLSPTPLSESIWLPVSERLDEFENRVWEEMIERHKLFQPIFLVSDAALRLCENPAAASLTVKVKTHKSVLAVCAPAAPAELLFACCGWGAGAKQLTFFSAPRLIVDACGCSGDP